jgi:hypothetical protein
MNALFNKLPASILALFTALAISPAGAQVPVDDSGAPLADYESFEPESAVGGEDIPLLSQTELQDLVGPIALYPDDLLAIVLPASTYPLQLVQAQRFLEDLAEDPSLTPDESWDDSVIALLNYPEVIALLNEDLDWTWRLGEAVVAQQADVVGAVQNFRDRAYAAGNLKSDTRQTVARNSGTIEIAPVEDDIIYVPYYEPERVVVYQPRPVYHYYPRAYPVYYYPYPVSHAFNSGFFWGVTTAFTVGWLTDSVHVIHHSYHGHPYYGRRYWDGWWYRRPTLHVHNHYYAGKHYSVSRHRYSRGDHWRPRYETRRRLHNQRITRSNYYAGQTVRHRSYEPPRPRTVERQRGVRTHSADRRQQRQQAGGPSASREATRRATRPERVDRQAGERRPRQAAQRTTRTERHVEERRPRQTAQRATRPERNVVERQRSRAQERQPRSERSVRREHRGSEHRPERRAATPQRQAPAQTRQRPAKERKQARNSDDRKRHASSRGESRRQRH